MIDHLTPDQIEKLNDGWHTAIVLGPFDFDTLHAVLTNDETNKQVGGTKQLWKEISAQLKQRHLLNLIGEMVDAIGEPE